MYETRDNKISSPILNFVIRMTPVQIISALPFSLRNFIFLLTMVEFNELLALRWSIRIADCQNFETPPCHYQDQKYANSREATRTSGNRFHLLPAQIIFRNRTHLLQIILCNTHTSLCILDRNLHLRIARLMMPLKGNAAENKNFPTYVPAQDHYGDCIQGLIFFVTDS